MDRVSQIRITKPNHIQSCSITVLHTSSRHITLLSLTCCSLTGVLFAAQVLIICFYARIALAFQRAEIRAHAFTGKVLLTLGSLYVTTMVLRYVLRMSWYPEERWAGGCLPIYFHLILASFLLLWGAYHWRFRQVSLLSQRTKAKRALRPEPVWRHFRI